MAEKMDWEKTTFEGSSRIEKLKKARAMTILQRLEAMDELFKMSERMQGIRKKSLNNDRS